MSSSSLQAYLDIVNSCIAQGGKFLALQGRYFVSPLPEGVVYERWKTPAGKWRDIDSNPAALRALGQGAWVGLVPATLGLVVLDLDEGDIGLFELVLDALDVGYVVVKSGKPGRAHFYLRAAEDWPKGNWNWSHGDQGGQVRFDNGYVICWDIEALPDALELGAGADLALAEHLGYRRGPAQPSLLDADAGLRGRLRDGVGAAAGVGGAGAEVSPERYPAGARNDVLLKDLNRLAHGGLMGADDAPALQRLYRGWSAADKQKPDHDSTFWDMVRRVREHVGAQKADKLAEGIFPDRSEETLRQALALLGVAWIYNERSGLFEYKRDGEALDYGNDTPARLIAEIASSFRYERPQGGALPLRYADKQFAQFMRALRTYPGRSHDDFAVWLDGLPAWDRVKRLDFVLVKLFGAADERLTWWAGRYLTLGPIQRCYLPGCKLDEFPVLIGKQGWGKSALLECLFPAEYQERWHSGSLDMTGTAREKIEAVRGSVLVEVAEMAGVGRELQKQKQWLSSRWDRMRMAYRRDSETVRRNFAFVGTADRRSALPNDPAGNRRFVAIELQQGADVEAYMEEHRLQLWAEGLHLWRMASREIERVANLPRALMERQAEVNEDFTRRDDEYDELVEQLDRSRLYSRANIVSELELGKMGNRDKAKLTAALEKAGWMYREVNRKDLKGRRWRHGDYQQPMTLD